MATSAHLIEPDASLHGQESKLLYEYLQSQRSVPKTQKSRSIGAQAQQLLQGRRGLALNYLTMSDPTHTHGDLHHRRHRSRATRIQHQKQQEPPRRARP